MKKRLLTTLSAVCITVLGMAQAVLPTTYSWDNGVPYPSGWTAVDPAPAYYTAASSAHTPPSLKMDATGDKVTINFTTTPGTLSYWITLNGGSGGTYNGTFLVEESVNGTTWTTMRSFTSSALPPAAWTPFSDTPNPASRYVRFNYSLKNGGNIGLDDVSLTAGVSTAQEINVKQGGTTIVNGGTYTTGSPVSTMLPITFTVQNLGSVSSLNVSAVNITGPAAADYSIATATSFTVPASSSANLVVNFTPSVAGTRAAVLSITNDDGTNNPYIINLDGIGGTLATEPTAQATNMTFPIVKSYRIQGLYSNASPIPSGYLVLRKSGSPITDAPADGTIYQRGDMIGSSKVVYSSNATGFFPNEIVANTTYYFAVFSYNGTGTYRNYLTASPLTGNVTTSGSMQPASYYNTVSPGASSFVTDLHSKINPHSIQFYSNYGPLMVAKLYARDTTGDKRVLTCVYSGLNEVYIEPFDWLTEDFSREHTYCQSWQPTVNSSTFQNMPEYNDYHMITPTNQNSVNALRSNYPLGEVVGTPTYTYLGCKMGNDAYGHKVFEPRDADKGDAARCMMYESICYTGVAYAGPANTNVTYGGSWSFPNRISNAIPYGQDQNVLKKWHYQDPPDNFEISRNDYVDSLQGNRNPFIDSVRFACYIDFMTMTKIPNAAVPCNNMTTGIENNENNADMILLAPNPSDGNFMLTYISSKSQTVSVKLFDMVGRIVFATEAKVSNGYNPIDMNVQHLSKGVYTFVFVSETGRKTEKLVIE